MGSWAFPAALFLLCLAPESSLQGGFGNPNGYRSGFGSPSGLGAGPPAPNGYTAGYGNRLAAAAFPGVGAQPGLEEGAEPQKPGYGHGYGLGAQAAEAGQARGFTGGGKSQQPEFGNGNGLGTGVFPRAGVQPDYGGVLKPQKPGMAQNGFGAGFGGGRKSQKPGYGTGLPAGAFPGPRAQPGYGYGWAVQPGAGEKAGNGGGLKPQKSSGKPPKPGYRNGMGVGAFPGAGAQPGLGGVGKSQKHPGLEGGMSQPKTGYSAGNGLVAQPGPCRSPMPGVPSAKAGGWGLKSHPPSPMQSGKLSVPTPATQWGLRPQKAGYQSMHGYGPPGPGTELGFGGGLRLQKVGFAYRRGILGLFPDARLQPGFPRTYGFRNGYTGYRWEAPMYSQVAVASPEGDGQARDFMGSPWPAGQLWTGGSVKPGDGYAGPRSQPGPYGQLRPELGPGPLGAPEVKASSSDQPENSHRGPCPPGKC